MRLPWRRGRVDAARRLASADAATRRSFVAALWAARGWETRVDGERVLARDHPNWADETLLVPAGGAVPAAVDDDVDAVVATSGDAPVRVVDAAELKRLAMYAVDRSVGERLARTHLDAPLVVDDAGTGAPRRLDAALVGVVVALAVAAVVGAAGAPAGTDPAPSVATETPASTTSAPGPTPDGRVAVGNLLAPGLSNEGVADADTLGAAHARAVADRSYVWLVSYREYRNRSRSVWPATRTERVVVRNDTHYRSEVGGWGELAGTPFVVADADAYADGSYRYTRIREGEGTTYLRSPLDGRETADDRRGTARRYAERAGRYVRWFLTARETRVHDVVTLDDRTYYRVTAYGSDYPGAENFSAVALVAPNGFVREVRVAYDLPETNRVVEVQLSYRAYGGGPERPDWYGDARNATRPVLGGADDAGRPPETATTRYAHDHHPPRPPRGNRTENASTDWATPADYRLWRDAAATADEE